MLRELCWLDSAPYSMLYAMESSRPSLDAIPPGTYALSQSAIDIASSSRPRFVERL
jgi:hypothetical protein